MNTKIQIRIILLFMTVILLSFIPENFREYFGDWKCNGTGELIIKETENIINRYYKNCSKGNNDFVGAHGPTWHWGFRHWIWFFMGITLFIINSIQIGIKIDKNGRNSN